MNLLKSDTPQNLFRKSAESIAHFIQQDGIVFRPYSSKSLPYFSALPEEEQNIVLANISAYEEICKEVFSKHGTLKHNAYMLEAMLKYYGWTIKPEDFTLISDSYLVEIYTQEHTQVFRSFSFFETSSYTLEDIYCRKWYHLYERNTDDQKTIIDKVQAFQMQNPPQKMKLDMPEQKIQEKESLERLVCECTIEWLVPVLKNSQMTGLMTLVRVNNRPYS